MENMNQTNDIIHIANLFELVTNNEVRYHIGQSAINTSLSRDRASAYYNHSDSSKVLEIIREGERFEVDKRIQEEKIREEGRQRGGSDRHIYGAQAPTSSSSPLYDPESGRREYSPSPPRDNLLVYGIANIAEQLDEGFRPSRYQFDACDDSDDEDDSDSEDEGDDEDYNIDLGRKVIASRDLYSLWIGEFRWRACYSSQLTVFADKHCAEIWFLFTDFVHDVYSPQVEHKPTSASVDEEDEDTTTDVTSGHSSSSSDSDDSDSEEEDDQPGPGDHVIAQLSRYAAAHTRTSHLARGLLHYLEAKEYSIGLKIASISQIHFHHSKAHPGTSLLVLEVNNPCKKFQCRTIHSEQFQRHQFVDCVDWTQGKSASKYVRYYITGKTSELKNFVQTLVAYSPHFKSVYYQRGSQLNQSRQVLSSSLTNMNAISSVDELIEQRKGKAGFVPHYTSPRSLSPKKDRNSLLNDSVTGIQSPNSGSPRSDVGSPPTTTKSNSFLKFSKTTQQQASSSNDPPASTSSSTNTSSDTSSDPGSSMNSSSNTNSSPSPNISPSSSPSNIPIFIQKPSAKGSPRERSYSAPAWSPRNALLSPPQSITNSPRKSSSALNLMSPREAATRAPGSPRGERNPVLSPRTAIASANTSGSSAHTYNIPHTSPRSFVISPRSPKSKATLMSSNAPAPIPPIPSSPVALAHIAPPPPSAPSVELSPPLRRLNLAPLIIPSRHTGINSAASTPPTPFLSPFSSPPYSGGSGSLESSPLATTPPLTSSSVYSPLANTVLFIDTPPFGVSSGAPPPLFLDHGHHHHTRHLPMITEDPSEASVEPRKADHGDPPKSDRNLSEVASSPPDDAAAAQLAHQSAPSPVISATSSTTALAAAATSLISSADDMPSVSTEKVESKPTETPEVTPAENSEAKSAEKKTEEKSDPAAEAKQEDKPEVKTGAKTEAADKTAEVKTYVTTEEKPEAETKPEEKTDPEATTADKPEVKTEATPDPENTTADVKTDEKTDEASLDRCSSSSSICSDSSCSICDSAESFPPNPPGVDISGASSSETAPVPNAYRSTSPVNLRKASGGIRISSQMKSSSFTNLYDTLAPKGMNRSSSAHSIGSSGAIAPPEDNNGDSPPYTPGMIGGHPALSPRSISGSYASPRGGSGIMSPRAVYAANVSTGEKPSPRGKPTKSPTASPATGRRPMGMTKSPSGGFSSPQTFTKGHKRYGSNSHGEGKSSSGVPPIPTGHPAPPHTPRGISSRPPPSPGGYPVKPLNLSFLNSPRGLSPPSTPLGSSSNSSPEYTPPESPLETRTFTEEDRRRRKGILAVLIKYGILEGEVEEYQIRDIQYQTRVLINNRLGNIGKHISHCFLDYLNFVCTGGEELEEILEVAAINFGRGVEWFEEPEEEMPRKGSISARTPTTHTPVYIRRPKSWNASMFAGKIVTAISLAQWHKKDTRMVPYYYSWCKETLLNRSYFRHCERCHTCTDWKSWHCRRCDRCSSDVCSIRCEWCGELSSTDYNCYQGGIRKPSEMYYEDKQDYYSKPEWKTMVK